MKILFVQKVKALAGSEKYFLQLVPALEKKGIHAEFACVYNKADKDHAKLFVEAYRAKGLTLHLLEVTSDRAIFKTLRFIRKIIANGDFDLIHSHLIHADFWCALLNKMGRIRIPLVSTKHGYDEQYLARFGFDAGHLRKNLYYRMCTFAEKQITRSFAVSEGLRIFFVQSGISKADKIDTIHHGFDLPPVQRDDQKKFRFSNPQILLLGRVIPFKGHHYLVEALPQVQAAFPSFKLVIAGHGDESYIKQLQARIDELQLRDQVIFTGYTTDAQQYMLHSDVMVIPSIAEGFGLVFLEALNAKIPVVGFDVPATNEIIAHEKTGLLVKPYDSAMLGKEIVKLLADRAYSNRLAEEGYARLKEYFTLERMVEQTRIFYESCIGSRNNSGKAG